MKGGPKQLNTVLTVHSHTGISGMKSHTKMAFYTKELDWSCPSMNMLQPSWYYTWDTMQLIKWTSGLERQSTGQESAMTSRPSIYGCDVCAKFARTQQKEMLQYVETPQTGWEQLGLDIFSLTLLICYLWVTMYDTVVGVAITNVTNIAN